MTAFKGLGTYGNGAGVVTPGDHKQADAGLLVKSAANLIRAGLFWGGNATIVTGAASMAYNIAAYTCATTRGATSGAVLGGNDGTLTLTKDVTGANIVAPGSNSAYHVVFHWHREFSIDGVDSNPVIAVIQGSSGASPSVPSLAAYPGAIALATILVPAGVTATNTGTTITQTAPFTAAAGGRVFVRNSAELALWTPADNEYATQLDTGVTSRRVSGAWKAWESDWITYTPTLTNVTVGTGGTATARSKLVGGVTNVHFDITLGTGFSITGIPTISLPSNALTPDVAVAPYNGQCMAYDTSASIGYLAFPIAGTTVGTARVILHGTNGILVNITSAVPFTFAATDIITGDLEYQAA